MSFNVGDIVVCIEPGKGLELSERYVVLQHDVFEHDTLCRVALLSTGVPVSGGFFSRRFALADASPAVEKKTIVLNEKAKRPIPPKPKTSPPSGSLPTSPFVTSPLWKAIKNKIPSQHRDALYLNLRLKWIQGRIIQTATTLDEALTWSEQPEGGTFWSKLFEADCFDYPMADVPWQVLYPEGEEV